MKVFLFVLSSIVLISCNSNKRKSFLISIEYHSMWAHPVKYYLTNSTITVHGVKGRSGNKIQNVYYRVLNIAESDSIYKLLQTIRYDTLQNRYDNTHFMDGTTIILTINGERLKYKRIVDYMSTVPIVDSIVNVVQSKVLNKSYKYDFYYE